MAKQPTVQFVCSHCDAQYTKWAGRCLECGKWGSIGNEPVQTQTPAQKKADTPAAQTTPLSQVTANNAVSRLKTQIDELDRVLGGGIVSGSFILLGGEPGIGKSTLSLQLAGTIPKTLYVSGEESTGQVALRAKRMFGNTLPDIDLSNEICVETIVATIKKQAPPVAIIDSIQTIYSTQSSGEPGSVTQVRACAASLLAAAKSTNTAIVLIGHVTKDGHVAGPRTLEHLVDTVLYLEGDRYHQVRMLRAVKNRFGTTDEVGIFEMKAQGLSDVKNPSELLLAERNDSLSGSVITCLLEGSRPLLVEVQALVNKTVFGYPVRKASGFDLNRLHVLIAVLEKRAGLSLGQFDVHVNIVGGMKVQEPAADLAVAAAIASAFLDVALPNTALFGEVGLGGEIRQVTQQEKRIKECTNLGVEKVFAKMPKKSNTSVAHIKTVVEYLSQQS